LCSECGRYISDTKSNMKKKTSHWGPRSHKIENCWWNKGRNLDAYTSHLTFPLPSSFFLFFLFDDAWKDLKSVLEMIKKNSLIIVILCIVSLPLYPLFPLIHLYVIVCSHVIPFFAFVYTFFCRTFTLILVNSLIQIRFNLIYLLVHL